MRLLPPSAGNFYYNYPQQVDELPLLETITTTTEKSLIQILTATTTMTEPVTIQTTPLTESVTVQTIPTTISSELMSIASRSFTIESDAMDLSHPTITFLVVGVSVFLILLFAYVVRFCLTRRERFREAYKAYNNAENVTTFGWFRNLNIHNISPEEVTQPNIERRLLDLSSPVAQPLPGTLSVIELGDEEVY